MSLKKLTVSDFSTKKLKKQRKTFILNSDRKHWKKWLKVEEETFLKFAQAVELTGNLLLCVHFIQLFTWATAITLNLSSMG